MAGFSSPYFSGYIDVASASYIEPSSSIGAFQVATIQNNLEWMYHFCNSQTRVNMQTRYQSNISVSASISASNTNEDFLIASVGPFRINLDKAGRPQPMYFCFVPGVYNTGGNGYATGSYTGLLRLENANGRSSILEVGTFVTTSQTSDPGNQTKRWQSFTTPSASLISGSFSTTGSIFQTSFVGYGLNQLATRTTKSLSLPDSTQNVALGYFDVYFKLTSLTGSANTIVALMGLYGREINIL